MCVRCLKGIFCHHSFGCSLFSNSCFFSISSCFIFVRLAHHFLPVLAHPWMLANFSISSFSDFKFSSFSAFSFFVRDCRLFSLSSRLNCFMDAMEDLCISSYDVVRLCFYSGNFLLAYSLACERFVYSSSVF